MLEVFDKIREIWKTITSINERLEALEKIHIKGPHPGFICPSCGKTTVRIFNEEKTETVLANYVTKEYTNYCHEEMTAKCTNKNCSFTTKDQDFIKKYFFHL